MSEDEEIGATVSGCLHQTYLSSCRTVAKRGPCSPRGIEGSELLKLSESGDCSEYLTGSQNKVFPTQ